mmetsp:Transcript_121990/g.390041  ORF Transcript_121990/g.390041 Transcript_121990/m.390041 type:complete len:262 (-) Transcript_121990:177-962(-)
MAPRISSATLPKICFKAGRAASVRQANASSYSSKPVLSSPTSPRSRPENEGTSRKGEASATEKAPAQLPPASPLPPPGLRQKKASPSSTPAHEATSPMDDASPKPSARRPPPGLRHRAEGCGVRIGGGDAGGLSLCDSAARSRRNPCAAALRNSAAKRSTSPPAPAAPSSEAWALLSRANSRTATLAKVSASGPHCGQATAAQFAVSMSSRRSSAACAAAAARSCAAPGAGGAKAERPEAKLCAGLAPDRGRGSGKGPAPP